MTLPLRGPSRLRPLHRSVDFDYMTREPERRNATAVVLAHGGPSRFLLDLKRKVTAGHQLTEAQLDAFGAYLAEHPCEPERPCATYRREREAFGRYGYETFDAVARFAR